MSTANAPLESSMATLSRATTILLATACGLIVANLYYSQPLAGPIGQDLGMKPEATGLVVTLTQLGYSFGLFVIVPLSDLFENRKLVLSTMALGILGLLASGSIPDANAFLAAAFLTGLGSVAIQILIPYAAHLSSEAQRGRAVGNVMGGLMLGIMLSRPLSSLIAEFMPWQTVFFVSAVIMACLTLVLAKALPPRTPKAGNSLFGLLKSMGRLAISERVLQRRAVYQSLLFGTFSIFWTTVPLLLASPAFGLSQGEIALFALAGAAGAIASPLAGWVGDKGYGQLGSAFCMIMVILAYLLPLTADLGTSLSLGLLAIAAIILDFGVTANLIFGQRAIFILGADVRGRLNALYMTTFYLGGAVGSAVGAWAYAVGGWSQVTLVGIACPIAVLLLFATERRLRG